MDICILLTMRGLEERQVKQGRQVLEEEGTEGDGLFGKTKYMT